MILFFGLAGSGKSTQVSLLAETMDWVHFSMGQYLRLLDNPVIKEQLARGEMVDTKVTNQAVKQAYDLATEMGKKLLVDGYPRQLDQANFLLDSANNFKIDAVVVLDVDEAEIRRRLLERGREDDTPEAIAQRFAVFEQETKQVIAQFEKLNVPVFHIDGNGSIEQTQQNLLEVITKHVATEENHR